MEKKIRLIDASALLEKSWDVDCRCGYVQVVDVGDIKDATTVDAVEVINAEWACVNESDNVWMCTGENGCGNEIILLEGTPNENEWYYCPHCGAKMDVR